MRQIIEDMIYERTDGPMLLRIVLRALSMIYGFGIRMRNFLYDHSILKPEIVTSRVVSVGNLTVGGTGKTPTVIMTAKLLMDAGFKVVVVSRGYGGKAKGPLVVSDGESVFADRDSAGDEPLIIARAMPGVPVIVGADRKKAAGLAIEKFRPRVILLDDGFQHRKLARTVDIVTVDGTSPFGNGRLLPGGLLREPPESLRRANIVIVTRWDDSRETGPMERMIRYYNRKVHIFYSRHVPTNLRLPLGGDTIAPDTLAGKQVAALSNIAMPSSFHALMKSLGARIVYDYAAPDHHQYTADELDGVVARACDAGADMLVMTAKDERNLPPAWETTRLEVRVLDIGTELFENVDAYRELILPQ